MAKRERRTGLATFEEAQDLIFALVKDGEWHTSGGIHDNLRKSLSDPMFGRVKKELGIEHRRVGGGQGSYYEWRMPPSRCAGTSPVDPRPLSFSGRRVHLR